MCFICTSHGMLRQFLIDSTFKRSFFFQLSISKWNNLAVNTSEWNKTIRFRDWSWKKRCRPCDRREFISIRVVKKTQFFPIRCLFRPKCVEKNYPFFFNRDCEKNTCLCDSDNHVVKKLWILKPIHGNFKQRTSVKIHELLSIFFWNEKKSFGKRSILFGKQGLRVFWIFF